jgi:hypothetical protein
LCLGYIPGLLIDPRFSAFLLGLLQEAVIDDPVQGKFLVDDAAAMSSSSMI